MTREEAMKNIQEILDEATEEEYSVCYVTSCDAEALQMAIEALKAQTSDNYRHGYERGFRHGYGYNTVRKWIPCRETIPEWSME